MIEDLLKTQESKMLEFKRDTSSLTPILKTVVAFANTAGGTLIIGRASDGELVGVDKVLDAEERLANAIADNIRPALLPDIEIVTAHQKDLLVIKVSHWRGPFYLKQQGIPDGVYIRLGSTSRPAGPELTAELQRYATNMSFDEQPMSDLSVSDVDQEILRSQFKPTGATVNERKLESLEVLVPFDHRLVPSVGGLILAGKERPRQRYTPDARVRCARFQGADKAYILDQFDPSGPLLEAIPQVEHFIARNTRLAAEIKAIKRKDIPEYSPVAIREALVNALAHADYALTGSTIQIAIFNDRLEIQNPGMLPFGYTLEDFKAGSSRIRNRVIARVFSKLALMEEWGGGYKRITEACREGGYPQPNWIELGSAIRVCFYPHPATQPEKVAPTPSVQARQREILGTLASGPLPIREIQSQLAFPISERTLRNALAKLAKEGFVARCGKGRGSVWQRAY